MDVPESPVSTAFQDHMEHIPSSEVFLVPDSQVGWSTSTLQTIVFDGYGLPNIIFRCFPMTFSDFCRMDIH